MGRRPNGGGVALKPTHAAYFLQTAPEVPWDPENPTQGVYVARFLFSENVVMTKVGHSERAWRRIGKLARNQDGTTRHGFMYRHIDSFLIRCRSRAEAKVVEAAMQLILDRKHVRGEWYSVTEEAFDRFRKAKLTAADVMALAAGIVANGEGK